MSGKKATFIRKLNWRGDARLYKLTPPLKTSKWSKEKYSCEYVVVSAVFAMFSGPETYIFPSDSEGKVTDFGELGGSYRGGLDHEAALRGAGYSTVGSEE